nr:retrotransposon protein, putative, unclassified [Tanacetum cinerariifolium]
MPALEDVSIFKFLSDDKDDSTVADINNLDATIQVSPILTTRIHKDHPLDQIKEEVYICQPPGFKDPDFPDRVYNVEKALYILHQALRACSGLLPWPKLFNKEVQLHAQVDGKEIVITESSVRRDLQLADEEGKGFSGKVTPLFPIMILQFGEGLAIPTNPQHTPTIIHHHHLNLKRHKSLGSLKERTLSLKRRVKKLEKINRSRTHKLKILYKVGLSAKVESFGDEESLSEDASKQKRRIDAIDADEDITLVNDADNEMFDVDDLGGEEVFVTGTVKHKKKDQIRLDEEEAKKLQAKFDEEERLAREISEKEERANIALIEE